MKEVTHDGHYETNFFRPGSFVEESDPAAGWDDLGDDTQLTDTKAVTALSSSVVTVLRIAGGDDWIANSARVSHRGEFVTDEKANMRLIDNLMKHRHGAPFESGYLEAHVLCPLFVAGQILRHRIGWSFSVKSGRYGTMDQTFYVPDSDRPLINVGTSMRPRLDFGDNRADSLLKAEKTLTEAYAASWEAYQELLSQGVANELARVVLPEGVYTELWLRCNPRSLMAFLSLRIDHAENTYETHPQHETQELALQLDDVLMEGWPLTYVAFNKHGRVAP